MDLVKQMKHSIARFKKSVSNENVQLMEELSAIQIRLEAARNRFEFAADDAAIESSIYEMESLTVQYRHLLIEAKERNLSQNFSIDNSLFSKKSL